VRVLIKTFGCKVNYADTEALVCALVEHGHDCIHVSGGFDSTAQPDVVVVNTCAVTAGAVKKARQFARRCLREFPQGRLIVTGCAAREESIASQFASLGVTILGDLDSITDELGQDGSPISIPRDTRTRRFIKIQDGCNSFCAYCIIPYVRPMECKPGEEVIAEIAQNVYAGTPEIVLCGINLGLYSEPDEGYGLTPLLKRVLEVLPESSRLRLSSIEPEHVTDEMLKLFPHPRLCPHLHLPLQSGSDSVLAAMRRKYDSTYYRNLVGKFRKLHPDAAVTTDLMVGFPTETEDDYEATCEMVRACAFERVHIFRFSTRPSTSASDLEQLPSAVVSRRQESLRTLCRRITSEALSRFIGEKCEVAIEDNGCGYGEAYQRVCVEPYSGVSGLVAVSLDALKGKVFKGIAVRR
jgi:threonylcarbamoyladenosine tRNA methylthiotransferase MtaB